MTDVISNFRYLTRPKYIQNGKFQETLAVI